MFGFDYNADGKISPAEEAFTYGLFEDSDRDGDWTEKNNRVQTNGSGCGMGCGVFALVFFALVIFSSVMG